MLLDQKKDRQELAAGLDLFLVTLGETAAAKGFTLLQELRAGGLRVMMDHEGMNFEDMMEHMGEMGDMSKMMGEHMDFENFESMASMMDGEQMEMMTEGMMEMMAEEMAEGGMEMMGEEGAAATAPKRETPETSAFGEPKGPAEIPKVLLAMMVCFPAFGDAVKAQVLDHGFGCSGS